jgi:hypothetical protein
MKDLIVKSAIAKESNFEGYVINQLGKRLEKLTVVKEKGCMKFKQKEWIERRRNDVK